MDGIPLMPLPYSTRGSEIYQKYLAGGSKMIDPLVLSSLISGGTNLLSGLLAGIGKGKAAKELKSATQPKTPYYETFSTLPYLQRLLQNSLIGALQQELPQSANWGINFNALLSMLNQTPTSSSPYNFLLQKYNYPFR